MTVDLTPLFAPRGVAVLGASRNPEKLGHRLVRNLVEPGFPGDVDGYAKINAAFSWGGPSLAVKVVENLTHITLNHVAIMDWNGLMGLTNALGGVRVYVPQTFTDDSQHIT